MKGKSWVWRPVLWKTIQVPWFPFLLLLSPSPSVQHLEDWVRNSLLVLPLSSCVVWASYTTSLSLGASPIKQAWHLCPLHQFAVRSKWVVAHKVLRSKHSINVTITLGSNNSLSANHNWGVGRLLRYDSFQQYLEILKRGISKKCEGPEEQSSQGWMPRAKADVWGAGGGAGRWRLENFKSTPTCIPLSPPGLPACAAYLPGADRR